MNVFISYRREDTGDITDRLYNRLASESGRGNIFRDVNSITPGADFQSVLRDAISDADLVLIVIGPRWLEPVDQSGRTRIDSPDDYVRLEITMTLELGKLAIPILVDRARIPAPSELPRPIQELSFRNAVIIRSESFDYDVESLQRNLRTQQERREGFCYLNRDGIDALCMQFRVALKADAAYGKRVQSLITHLDSQNLLSMEARPGDLPYALITSQFEFIQDDAAYLSFRSQPYGFSVNMNKSKSTFWPYQSRMPKLSHIRIALGAGVQLWVFGEWYSAEYLRPHAASVIGFNLRGSNTLF